MTKFQKFLRFLSIVGIGLIFSQCSKDDDNTIPTFSESQMSLIHGDSEKSWRITEIINRYADTGDDLYFSIDCVSDDIYTFSAATNKATVSYGSNLCFEDLNEGIFRADQEYFGASLLMLGSPETIYVSFGRGYVNDENTAFASTFAYYAVAELSENKMVIYKSISEIKGDYYEAYTFEAIQ